MLNSGMHSRTLRSVTRVAALTAVAVLAACSQGPDGSYDEGAAYSDEELSEMVDPIHGVGPEKGSDNAAVVDAQPEPEIRINGRVLRLVGKSRGSTASVQGAQARSASSGRPLSTYTLDELAMAVRPYVERDGYDYAMQEPDYETAQAILDNIGKVRGTVTTPPREGREVFGPDTRSYNGSNTVFPQTAYLMSEAGCTATMISRSVAITAAHCMWNPATDTWVDVDREPGLGAGTRKPRWTAAVDGQDADPFPFTNGYMGSGAYEVNCNNVPAGPTAHGSGSGSYSPNCTSSTTTSNPGSHIDCYQRAVSQEYKDAAGSPVAWDFAFLDFSGCAGRPGDWLGFIGAQTLSEATIEAVDGNIWGFPGAVQTSGSAVSVYTQWWSGSPPAFLEGEFWGASGSVTLTSSTDNVLRYTMDTSGGQSGASIWRNVSGARVIYGNHKGRESGTSNNWGRRFDSSVDNWARSYTAYPN